MTSMPANDFKNTTHNIGRNVCISSGFYTHVYARKDILFFGAKMIYLVYLRIMIQFQPYPSSKDEIYIYWPMANL